VHGRDLHTFVLHLVLLIIMAQLHPQLVLNVYLLQHKGLSDSKPSIITKARNHPLSREGVKGGGGRAASAGSSSSCTACPVPCCIPHCSVRASPSQLHAPPHCAHHGRAPHLLHRWPLDQPADTATETVMLPHRSEYQQMTPTCSGDGLRDDALTCSSQFDGSTGTL
jgi:hypothetical protein